jgi:hypothetical protein
MSKSGIVHQRMPRLNWVHFVIVFVAIVPNAMLAYLLHSWLQGIGVAMWLIIPCSDKQFGNGKKYYWMRQSIFIIGLLITVMLGVA